MVEANSVPYFPFKLFRNVDEYFIRNPLTGQEYDINPTAVRLLKLCDGYRTWDEIIAELKNSYSGKLAELSNASQGIIEDLKKAGILWSRYQRIKGWKTPAPKAVLWDLTNRCNLSCKHCVVNGGMSKDGELSLADCKRVAGELADFGVKQLILSGGEPLMRKDFFKIASHAANLGLSLQIATNATLITRDVAKNIAALGANAQVSLDGATPEVHEVFRNCKGSWKLTIRGIRNLVEFGVPVMIACVINKTNIAEIPALYQLASNLSAYRFRILPFVPYGRGLDAKDLEVSPEQMQEVTSYLIHQRQNGSLPVAQMEFECTFANPPTTPVHAQTRIGCDGAISYCGISSTGEVLPCNFFEGVDADNVKKFHFAEIWKNSRFLNYFRSLTVSDLHESCRLCLWLPACRGSCIATNYTHGDIFKSNPHCWIAMHSSELKSNNESITYPTRIASKSLRARIRKGIQHQNDTYIFRKASIKYCC